MAGLKFAKKWFNANRRDTGLELREEAFRRSNIAGFNLLTFAARSGR